MQIKFQILFIITFLFISLSDISSMEGLATSEISNDGSSSSSLRGIPMEDDSVPLMLSPLSPLAQAKAVSLETYFDRRQKERTEQEELEIAIASSKLEQKHVSPASQVEEVRHQLDIIRTQRETLKFIIDERTVKIDSMTHNTSELDLNDISISVITRIIGDYLNENQADEDHYMVLLEEKRDSIVLSQKL